MSSQVANSISPWGNGTDLRLHYPKVRSVPVPLDSGAQTAFRATINPFSGAADIDGILWHLQSDRPLAVSEGTLLHPAACAIVHPKHPLRGAVNSSLTCEVLVLDFGDKRHPLAFALKPEISRDNFPGHPHLLDNRLLSSFLPKPALCLYRPSDGVFTDGLAPIISFFDFLAFFLAKHHVWENTRVLLDRLTGRIVERPAMRTNIVDATTWKVRRDAYWWTTMRFVWQGVWLGESASHEPRQQLEEIPPWAECPCGSGDRYRDCHRTTDRQNRNFRLQTPNNLVLR